MGYVRVRKIAVITVGRSDYGMYESVLHEIRRHRALHLQLIVAGMHLAPAFGNTLSAIEEDGYEIADRVEMLVASDTPEAVAISMGLGTIGFARAYAQLKPDLCVVLGDRFEMHAAAVAAVPLRIPLAHIHGGELTEGAIDNALRHSITKLSHLHFVSTEEYGRRVIQMGEEPWRVHVVGAPSLDNLRRFQLARPALLQQKYGIRLTPQPLLVTYHPATLDSKASRKRHIHPLLSALDAIGMPVIFTGTNADQGSSAIRAAIGRYVESRPDAKWIENLGRHDYFSLMSYAAAMVGNSSSGIIEASSFGLPVVNIGTRQRGRIRAANVIDCGDAKHDIAAAIQRATSQEFRAGLAGLRNPYSKGGTGKAIVKVLAEISLGERLLRKCFHELRTSSAPGVHT